MQSTRWWAEVQKISGCCSRGDSELGSSSHRCWQLNLLVRSLAPSLSSLQYRTHQPWQKVYLNNTDCHLLCWKDSIPAFKEHCMKECQSLDVCNPQGVLLWNKSILISKMQHVIKTGLKHIENSLNTKHGYIFKAIAEKMLLMQNCWTAFSVCLSAKQ